MLPVLMGSGEEPDYSGLEAIVQSEAEDAIDFIDDTIGHDRAVALRYYRGDPLGNEEEGRSKMVSRDVRDAVHSVLPSLMRVFFSSERAVEFMPTGPEDVEMAEQATDYVNFVILNDNPGVAEFYACFKDSLISKVGIMKWWRDERVEVSYHEFTDKSDAELALLMREPGAEVVKIESRPAGPPVAPDQLPPSVHDFTIKRTRRSPRIRIAAVPPEEFLIDRRAKDIETARYVGHRQLLPIADLVALGYSRELAEKHIHHADVFRDAENVWERHTHLNANWQDNGLNDDEREVVYTEHYLRYDLDDDGLSEMLKVCTMGENYEIVHVEACDERPFADFCPDPEPHLFWGSDIADLTKDLQFIATNIKRAILDSLAQSLYPRTAYVEGRVDADDVLNTEIGAVIRMDAPGMVQPFTIPFVGTPALQVLDQLVETEKDRRVGTHNLALEADALQSTTKAAVNAQVDAAQQRLEMIARLYAEGGMARLFKGVLKLVHAHQTEARMVRLRGRYVAVDPATWNANMDVTVNTGLGNGMSDERMLALREGLNIQREVLQSLGPANPMVSLGQLSNSIAKLYEMAGFKDTSAFVTTLPKDFTPPQPPPKPDPAELLAQVEVQKKQADMVMDAAQLELDRDKLVSDILLKIAEMGVEIDIEQIKASMASNELVS